MIIEVILNGFVNLLSHALSLVPSLPQLPNDIANTIDSVFNQVFNYVALLNLFIPIPLVITLLTLSLSIVVIKYTWAIIDWVLRHIPVFGTH